MGAQQCGCVATRKADRAALHAAAIGLPSLTYWLTWISGANVTAQGVRRAICLRIQHFRPRGRFIEPTTQSRCWSGRACAQACRRARRRPHGCARRACPNVSDSQIVSCVNRLRCSVWTR